jgi:protoporphyrinogen oxidase
MNKLIYDILIIGAGPAGLSSGYILSQNKNLRIKIIEDNKKYVGGISRTEKFKGYRFDIGGHRFFSKSKEINDLWDKILPNDLLERKRKSRIFFKNKFYNYPLDAVEVILNLGMIESLFCFCSYIKSKISPVKNPKSFHDYIYNNFGERLYKNFFKTYTEKVWGISCDDISADWAAQRIKNLDLYKLILSTIRSFFFRKSVSNKQKIIKTLIDKFKYPTHGPGMMWEKTAEILKKNNIEIDLGVKSTQYYFNKKLNLWKTKCVKDENIFEIESKIIISSAPLREVALNIFPELNSRLEANKLKYRDYIIVALLLKNKPVFDDNWIYIHEPSVNVGRIQNFSAWSENMTPEPNMGCIGMEFFCNENDKFWNMKDNDLGQLAINEIKKLNLIKSEQITDYYIIRQKKAYPVYDETYKVAVKKISDEIETLSKSFFLVGRNGMHKYNNQDHAMMTGILTAKNILAGKKLYNVWGVNEDAEYLETEESELRLTPKKINS